MLDLTRVWSYWSVGESSKAVQHDKKIRRGLSTRTTQSLSDHLQGLKQDPRTLSDNAVKDLGADYEYLLALANSTATSRKEELERQDANNGLITHLANTASHLTMTAQSMQPWDGDCWFAATAFHLNRLRPSGSSPITAATLRKDVVTYMSSDSVKTAFVEGPYFIVDENYKPHGLSKKDQYEKECTAMKKSGCWTRPSSICDIAVICLATVTDSYFTIYQSGRNPEYVGDENASHKIAFGRVETSTAAHIHALIRKETCTYILSRNMFQ